MTPEAWRRVGELFHEALGLPSGERTQWVTAACSDDGDLCREVLSLLESDRAAADGFVASQVQSEVVALHEEQVQSRAGMRAGPYRLVREIGRGGMGAVYLARRDDEQYEIDVAVKLVTPGMDTQFVLQRFRRERQILANLTHPNIARLLDGGTTDDGLPYIVMEYIDGEWLTTYSEQRNLSVEQRIVLFLNVCSAVAHAHRSFVVHRDLK